MLNCEQYDSFCVEWNRLSHNKNLTLKDIRKRYGR